MKLPEIPATEEQRQLRLGKPVVVTAMVLVTFCIALLVGLHLSNLLTHPAPWWQSFVGVIFVVCTVPYWSSESTRLKRLGVTLAALFFCLFIITTSKNGYLALAFLCIALLVVMSTYRGRFRLLLPYVVVGATALALLASTSRGDWALEARILLFSGLLIYPLHLIFEAFNLDQPAKSRAAAAIFAQLAILAFVLTIERTLNPESTINPQISVAIGGGSVAIFGALWRVLSTRRTHPRLRYAVLGATVIAYWANLSVVGLYTVCSLPMLILISYLVLSSFNALMLSLGLCLLSVLGFFVTPDRLTELLPIGIRLLAAGVIFALMLFSFFRYRERELGETDISLASVLKMFPLALLATVVIALLLFDGLHTGDQYDLAGLSMHNAKEETGVLLTLLIFTWGFSALHYGRLRAEKLTEQAQSYAVDARTLANNLEASLRETELALKAGDISIYELDLESGITTMVAGTHPELVKGDTFNIDAYAKRILASSGRDDVTQIIRQENSEVQFSALYPGDLTPKWSQITTGKHFEVDGRIKSIYLRADITELRSSHEAMRIAKEQQRDLFAVVGHELRTPIASMQMIMQDSSTSKGEKLALLEDINAHLLDVLEDMRGVVAPERAQRAKLVVSNPVSLVQRALTPLSELVSKHQLTLHSNFARELDHEYRYRAQALRQIVTNLVKNAAIHSDGANIWVALELKHHNERTAAIMLTVEDDGKGIPPADVERVFAAFGRGETDKDGSGLGLFIASQLAENLGGTLSYSARESGGSRFTVDFEVESVESEAQAQAQAQAQDSLEGMRVLLAEDDKMLRMLTEKTLSKEGALITACEDGQEAFERFAAAEIDLVLTDLMMPRMSGLELITRLRASGETLPIIAVTAAVIGEETDELITAGANAVISKPISLQKLMDAMADLERRDLSA